MKHLRLRPTIGRAVLVVMAGTVLASGAPGWRWRASGHAAAQAAPAALVDLQSAAELRTQFNEDRGNTRLVLLLSPT
jgi:hypothetical protein